MKRKSTTRRIAFVHLVVVALGALLVVRLFFIQVLRHDYYQERAVVQQTTSNPFITHRGDIYFTEKDGTLVSAATMSRGYYLAIAPPMIDDAEQLYQSLSRITALDETEFFSSAKKKSDPFEVVARRLSTGTGTALLRENLDGVNVGIENWRFYPGGNLAAHLLGFFGYKNEEREGRYGIERFYENALMRERAAEERDDAKTAKKSLLAGVFAKGKSIFTQEREPSDIVLTIEPTVQRFLERALDRLQEQWNGSAAGGVIVEPATGKILALAARPDFNPNVYQESPTSAFVNPIIEHVFEVGSIFKPLTLAAALDQKRITPETTYVDRGFIELNNARIENFDAKGRGKVPMQEVLNQSLNTGAVFVMQKLGKENFRNYIERYGFMELSGIDLPGEAMSNTANLHSNRDIEYATASFGQGIAVTPIALVAALSSLANGGLLMRPYVVEKIDVPFGADTVQKPLVRRRVIEEETSRTISDMLVDVVDRALLGGATALEHYTVAAKTGTAQMPRSDARGYSDDFFHSFFGYAPATTNARFLVFLYIEKPQGVQYASHSIGPTFRDIMQFLLNYYEVPPDR